MNWIQQQLAHAPAPNTITHLGAGLCSELDIYLGCHPRRIYLVEPNLEALPELRRRSAQDERISIIPVAVSGREGRRALKLFNYPDLASLHQPTGLIDLLPGLRQTGQAIIDVITAHTLPRYLQLEGEENNWLIVDTPGDEFASIEGLANHEQLHQFDHIILKAGAESLYEGSRNLEEIAAYLQRLGYLEEGVPDNADVDWPRLHLRLNPLALEFRRLRRKNEALTEQKTKLEKQNEELTEQLQRQMNRAEKRTEELEAAQQHVRKQEKELSAQIDDLHSRLEKLAKEIATLEKNNQELTEELQQQKKHAKKRVEELEAEQQHAQQQEKELEVQCDDLNSRLEKLAEAKVALQKQNQQFTNELQRENERLQAENEVLRNELYAARSDLQQQRSDVSVALRLQNLRENDLKELQQRYGHLKRTNQGQKELLAKLHQRLSVAADYLRLINEQHDDGDELQEGLVRALTGSDSEDA